ncbi:hypothetical protein G8768_06465 [Pseudoteredinibacter isoporae]|nr:hypothetical protein [Pseudoteredinibacter isoporae]NIB24961.1 hypothetical protein [Pseudoteredinibacter isoporae]
MARLKIGTGCGCCMMAIRMFLTEVNCQQRSS